MIRPPKIGDDVFYRTSDYGWLPMKVCAVHNDQVDGVIFAPHPDKPATAKFGADRGLNLGQWYPTIPAPASKT